jgi:cholesterol oxidase
MPEQEHFDAVVIGSGFGGSVMTWRLGEAGKRVCLLERGKRYPPGSFARSPIEMRDNFWDPSESKYGLFQIWRFGDIDGVVSAGLGGGSLIYANVFLRKDERWFYRREPGGGTTPWPVNRSDLEPHYDNVEAVIGLQQFPFDKVPYSSTPKTIALSSAAANTGTEWFTPPLAVTFGDPVEQPVPGEPIKDAGGSTTNNIHGRTRSTCRLCGECDLGCNYGSKNTLDYTYLTLANRLANVEIRDLCEVQTFAPRPGGGFSVSYRRHDPEAGPGAVSSVEVTCDKLVLSAGTFGTAYLLLKNAANFRGLSQRLGEYFSGNGDYLGLFLDAKDEVAGTTAPRLLAPSHGSVITSTVRVPDIDDPGGTGPGFYIQDGGYPGFVDWLVESSNLGGELHRALRFIGHDVLGWIRHHDDSDIDDQLEALIGDAHSSSSILPVLGMGLDTPGGKFSLSRDSHPQLELDWSASNSQEYFDAVKGKMRELAENLGARFLEDPLSHLHNKVVTVHALGGCSMGDSIENGVVDTYGEVFAFPGFFIADGSVMPGPVGPNPSFTIAALSDRFADRALGLV